MTNLVLLALVLAALAGLLGVRSGTATAAGDGFELEVTYPAITRAGLASPFDITVTHRDGFDGPIVLALRSEYLALFDENSITPSPASQRSEGDWVVWDFSPPDGRTFTVSIDVRVEPAVHSGRDGQVQVRGPDGAVLAETSFRTVVLP